MRDDIRQEMWLKIRAKKRVHWSVLTLDDLDMTNVKYVQLIARLRAQFQAANERAGERQIHPKSDDFPISKEIPHAHEETV